MNTAPTSLPEPVLEERAAEQRQQIHRSAEELRHILKEKMDVKRNAREHLPAAIAATSFIALILGYSFAGMFTRR